MKILLDKNDSLKEQLAPLGPFSILTPSGSVKEQTITDIDDFQHTILHRVIYSRANNLFAEILYMKELEKWMFPTTPMREDEFKKYWGCGDYMAQSTDKDYSSLINSSLISAIQRKSKGFGDLGKEPSI